MSCNGAFGPLSETLRYTTEMPAKQQQKSKPPKPQPKTATRRRRGRRQPLSAKARKDLKALPPGLAALALPREHPPVRYPVFGQALKTAVFNLYADTVFNHRVTGAPTDLHGSNWLICPSPIHPVWGYFEPAEKKVAHIDWRLATTGSLVNIAQIEAQDLRVSSIVRVDARYPALAPLSEDHTRHTTGHARNGMFYIPEGCLMEVEVSDLANPTVHTMTLEFGLNHLTDVSTAQVVATIQGGKSDKVEVTPSQPGWAYLKEMRSIEGDFAQSTTFAVRVTISARETDVGGKLVRHKMLLPLFPILERETLKSARESARVTAASLLITNTSTSMFKGGAFLGGRILSSINNPFTVSEYSAVISNRAGSERYSGEGQLGLYSFTTPSKGSMTFSDYSLTNLGEPSFQLDDLEVCNIVNYAVNKTGTMTGDTGILQEFLCVMDYHMESRLTSQVFPLRLPTMKLQQYEDFLSAAASVVPFTENPLHIGALSAKLAQLFWSSAPYLVPLAQMAISKGAKYLNSRLDGYY